MSDTTHVAEAPSNLWEAVPGGLIDECIRVVLAEANSRQRPQILIHNAGRLRIDPGADAAEVLGRWDDAMERMGSGR